MCHDKLMNENRTKLVPIIYVHDRYAKTKFETAIYQNA